MESASAPAHEDSGPDSRPQPFPEYFEPPSFISQPVSGSGPGPGSRIAHTTANTSNSNGSVYPRADGANANAGRDRDVSGVIPPYWSHHRNSSRASQASLEPLPPITLEDHTEDPNSETSRGLWARSVAVDDHAVVQGKTGVGAYVVWSCRIQTLDVSFFFLLFFIWFYFSFANDDTGRSDYPSYEVRLRFYRVHGKGLNWLTGLGTLNSTPCDNNSYCLFLMRKMLFRLCRLKVSYVCHTPTWSLSIYS